MIVIDGKNQILGRVGTVVAKRALEGENVHILNCEKMIITGNKKDVLAKYNRIEKMSDPIHGPFLPKMPDRLVKRIIRGMLPHKQERGREALKRIKCYIGVPENFEGKETYKVKNSDSSKLTTVKYVTIGEISKYLGKNKW